ncbi:MAG: CBS domain-containing protein [Dehalococcoidia bacterium]
MKAEDIMNQPVIAATKSTTARDVAIQMLMGGYSGMPITEADGGVVGIVTELDLIRALRAGRPLETTRAEEIMTKEVISVDVSATVDEVMELLDTNQIVRVPVTEEGRLTGIISRPDVIRGFIEPKFMTFS